MERDPELAAIGFWRWVILAGFACWVLSVVCAVGWGVRLVIVAAAALSLDHVHRIKG